MVLPPGRASGVTKSIQDGLTGRLIGYGLSPLKTHGITTLAWALKTLPSKIHLERFMSHLTRVPLQVLHLHARAFQLLLSRCLVD